MRFGRGSGSPEERSLREAEKELQRAQFESDVAALGALLHEELRFSGPDGNTYGKQDDLDAHRRGSIRFSKLRERSLTVEVTGDTGVTDVVVEIAGEAYGKPFDGVFNYQRTWLRDEGAWQIVVARATAVG